MKVVVGLLVGLLVVGPAGAAAHAGDREDYERSLGTPPSELVPTGLLGHTWRGVGTAISGDATVSRGELVLEDRPFDDTGADTSPVNGPAVQTGVDTATLSGLCGPGSAYSTGDLSYPAGDAYRKNSADLVQVRVARRGGDLHVLWQLETLVDATTTTVALLVDTDRDATTGAALGFGGYEAAVVVAGGAGSLSDLPVRAAVDLAGNTVQAALPLSSLPSGPWRVNAVSGLLTGGALGALADAAHVADEPVLGAKGCKLDVVQSMRLAQRRLDGVPLDLARLVRGDSDRPALRRGAFTRSYLPARDGGEGRSGQTRYGQTSSADVYRGTVQPYSVYVPSTYDPARRNPVILLLHCLTCWHTVYDVADLPVELAESRGALIVTPFGLGEGGHYEGEAQTDAFEVLSDVSRRYRVDADRLYLTGMSMGSLGTYRFGGLFPDLWARQLAVESYTTPFCPTATPRTPSCVLAFNYLDLFPSYRNLPTGIVQGALDELTPVTGGREFADTLTALGYPLRYWEWPNRTHDPKMHGLTTDVTGPFLGDARRERSPATVTYVMDRAMVTPGQSYDRAYWLSGLHLADGERFGRVDATSGRGRGYTTMPVSGSGTDEAGPWAMRGLDGVPAAPSGSNELTLTLSDVDRVTVDPDGALLTRDEPLVVVADSDRAAVLLVGDERVDLPAGRSRTLLAPRRSGVPGGAAPVVPLAEGAAVGVLPTTGWGPGPAAALLLLGGLAAHRRRGQGASAR